MQNADGIHEICLGLVDIRLTTDDETTANSQDTQIETAGIAHFSVQDHLESERIPNQKAAIFSLTAVTAHAEMAEIFLVYLLEPGLTFTQKDKYPLANYALLFSLLTLGSFLLTSLSRTGTVCAFFPSPRVELLLPLCVIFGAG